jgi:sensor c-di-GMP phosphodiesterase-like protein
MMRTLKQRVLVVLLAMVFGAAAGMGAGYLVGRAVALNAAKSQVDKYAGRLLTAGGVAADEGRSVIEAVKSSPYPFCSDAEIQYFRRLIFQSQYLKDTGRMQGDNILCSGTLGRRENATAPRVLSFPEENGAVLYKNLPPFQIGTLTVVTRRVGDSFVVFSPEIEQRMGEAPMRFNITGMDLRTGQPIHVVGTVATTNAEILTREGQYRSGDNLLSTHCNRRYATCVTASISISDAILLGRSEIAGTAVAGGLIGLAFGFLCSLFYGINKGMERQLRRSIRQDELRVVYQPIVELPSRRIVGAEALVRWTDEDGCAIGPDIFVKLAEQRDFVGEITTLVVRHVLRDFGEFLRNHPDFCLSINVAAADLDDPQFSRMLDRSMEQAGVAAQSLALEITESCTAGHRTAIDAIAGLRRRGHSIHIDDFGTGYSSLSYLHSLSIDAIKIDKSFTHAVGTEAVTVSILPQILAMADTLRLQVIVEGIETEEQAEYFSAGGQNFRAQGWLFGHPVPSSEFHRLLAEGGSKTAISTRKD